MFYYIMQVHRGTQWQKEQLQGMFAFDRICIEVFQHHLFSDLHLISSQNQWDESDIPALTPHTMYPEYLSTQRIIFSYRDAADKCATPAFRDA